MSRLSSAFSTIGRPAVFVIAEAGVNHDGSVADAHALVDVAADAAADAIKFQTFDPAALVSATAAATPYQVLRAEVSTQRELLERYVLPEPAWAELRDHAVERNLEFLSTAFDLGSLDLVCGLGVSALKIGSGELTNRPLLVEVARRGLPVICSTGMGTLDEVGAAVEWLSGAPALMLLHCVSSYPAPTEQSNLLAIETMRARFGLPVGWSDHTVGATTAVAAVALGAAALEKHVTLDNSRSGPDHAASADPAAFGVYVEQVRAAAEALGDGVKRPVPAEADNRPLVRRSWHLVSDRPAGHRLAEEDLALLRPATGIAPDEDLVGRVLGRDMSAGEPITDEVLG